MGLRSRYESFPSGKIDDGMRAPGYPSPEAPLMSVDMGALEWVAGICDPEECHEREQGDGL